MQARAAASEVSAASLETHVDRIVELYRRAGRALRAADPADWAAGVTMSQLRLLFFLGRSGPASVGEVAAGVGVTQPSATELLDRLVRAGLVERATDAGDRRIVRNALTEVGRETIHRPWETRRAVLASALRGASATDRAAIARGLELLCCALDRVSDSGTPIEPVEPIGVSDQTDETHAATDPPCGPTARPAGASGGQRKETRA